MANSDIEFTFNTEGFDKAMKTIENKMGDLGEQGKKISEESTKSISKGVTKGMISFSVISKIFTGILKTVDEFVPEIKQTFEISKNIIMKNLLHPLRMELLPILQKVFDWVRNNRLLFAQLGSVLVNVFRVIKTLAETVFNLAKPIIEVFKNTIQGIFGGTVRTVSDTINLVLFKITAFIIFLGILLSPLTKSIGMLLKSFIDLGITIAKSLFGSNSKGWIDTAGSLVGAFRMLADIVTVLLDALNALISVDLSKLTKSSGISDLISMFGGGKESELIKNIKNNPGAKSWQSLIDYQRGSGNSSQAGQNVINAKANGYNVQDAIITKDGKVIRTAPDDNIIATKNLGSVSGKSVNLTMNFGDFNFTVTEGNAKGAGINFVGGLQGQIKNILLDNMVLSGAQ